jgi:beta-lactamase class A
MCTTFPFHAFRRLARLVFFITLLPHLASGQPAALRQKIEQVARAARGDVGVAVLHLERGDTLSVRGKGHFPTQSVYKFPVAMAVLHQVDRGKLSLDQKIHLTRRDLLPNTHSPLRDKYPDADVNVSLAEILRYTVSLSDNNGCDVLFRLLGGTGAVDQYVRSLGVKGMAIAATEEQMHQAWDVQYTNWSEPVAMAALLKVFYERKHLSRASADLLWKLMVETPTGAGRIKGLLPKETVVAHKTGTSGTNDQGVAAATNDAGIVTLPNGEHVAIVVFVANATADLKTREEVIARISRAVWDEFTAKR